MKDDVVAMSKKDDDAEKPARDRPSSPNAEQELGMFDIM